MILEGKDLQIATELAEEEKIQERYQELEDEIVYLDTKNLKLQEVLDGKDKEIAALKEELRLTELTAL